MGHRIPSVSSGIEPDQTPVTQIIEKIDRYFKINVGPDHRVSAKPARSLANNVCLIECYAVLPNRKSLSRIEREFRTISDKTVNQRTG